MGVEFSENFYKVIEKTELTKTISQLPTNIFWPSFQDFFAELDNSPLSEICRRYFSSRSHC